MSNSILSEKELPDGSQLNGSRRWEAVKAALLANFYKPDIGAAQALFASVDGPSIPDQKAVEAGPQNGRCLLVPAPRLNAIHRKLVTAEGPHPPQLSSHLPARFVRCHAGRAANLFD